MSQFLLVIILFAVLTGVLSFNQLRCNTKCSIDLSNNIEEIRVSQIKKIKEVQV